MRLEKNFCLCLQNRRKLVHRKNEILVLFCPTTDMFAIHGIKNSSFVYVKHVLLEISIKGPFESNKYLLFNASQTPHFT